MDRDTLAALKGSIRKWEKIVAGTGVDRESVNCPLCELFFGGSRTSCHGCPVTERTGRSHCIGSPYVPWIELANYGLAEHRAYTEEQFQAAQDELEFLRSLMPKEMNP